MYDNRITLLAAP